MSGWLRDPAGIKELLKSCTALVIVNGKPKGSAFFVTERLLLTCEHVVRRATELQVRPFRSGETKRVSLARPASAEHDLALLQLEAEDIDPGQPSVALDTALHDTAYSIAGYPREDQLSAGLEVLELQGHPREAVGSGESQLLQLEAGKIVTWGNSGGPALDMSSGAVVGVVRTSKNPMDALGGGAVPLAMACEVFDEVAACIREPPMSVRRWRDALGREQWQALGKVWDLHARVNVSVSGKTTCWRIGIEPPVGLVKEMVGSDLGEDVAEALFRWAQRRRIRDEQEVALLARLLAGALFPQPLAQHLSRLAGADEVTVRLNIESGSDLANIPWELAAVPGAPKRFLAADDQYRLVRVLKNEQRPTGPPLEELTIVGVVSLPSRWEYPIVYGEDRYDWPATDAIATRLHQHINGSEGVAFQAYVLVDPLPAEVRDPLPAGVSSTVNVFHFMGVGRLDRQGRPQVALVNERNTDGRTKVGPKWESLEKVLGWAVQGGATLAVLEFLLPPVDSDDEPITLSALSEALPAELVAAVATRFPVHPMQAAAFNETFYEQLRHGESVETATQLARRDVEQNAPVEDGSGFGWFTLVTRAATDYRLAATRPSAPQHPGTRKDVGPADRTDGRDRPAAPRDRRGAAYAGASFDGTG